MLLKVQTKSDTFLHTRRKTHTVALILVERQIIVHIHLGEAVAFALLKCLIVRFKNLCVDGFACFFGDCVSNLAILRIAVAVCL